MKTIEYRSVDKSEWSRGQWDDEPDKVQFADEATGLPCLIVRGPSGALCGYVGVPDGHPFYKRGYDDCDVSVHGGLTFASHCSHGAEDRGICHLPEAGEPDSVWWLGFDCAHSGDYCPSHSRYRKSAGDTMFQMHEWETYKDVDYVRREVADLAAQIALVTK